MFTWATSLFSLQIQAVEPVSEVRAALPEARLSGQAKMRFWGFEVYQASLWVTPGFSAAGYAQSPFALELTYLRDFKGADIAKRSIAEMRRQAPLSSAQESAWETQMRTLFPDVKIGDRITGVHQPGLGAVFWHNTRRLGEIKDPAFAKLFFGIWLSEQTSEPQLRRALLAQSTTQITAPGPAQVNAPTARTGSGTP